MRRITEHRLHESDFSEAIRSLVRSSPWWMVSLLLHLVLLLVLWSIRIDTGGAEAATVIASGPVQDPPDPDPPEEVPPPEMPPPEDIVEVLTPDIEEDPQTQSDTDSDHDQTAFDDGEADAPFTGPSVHGAIGIGGMAGGGRGGPGGRTDGRVRGSHARTDDLVDLGLRWLAEHQDVREDGRWDCDDFAKHDPAGDRCDGAGAALHDVGVTGLALLAFLGAGHTDVARQGNPYAGNVRQGLRFLMASQDEEGCFGSRSSKHFLYDHGIAAIAMAEAYWMTRNPRYRRPAQKGLDFISHARNPYLAWRYEPRGGENDMSVTGWMVMALKSGKFAGLEIDPDAFDGARLFVDKMTDPEFGQVGYDTPGGQPARPEGLQERFPPEKSQSMTAVGVLTRIFLGEDPSSPIVQKGADLCMERLPEWNPNDGSIDMYYWYYGTLAMFQVGGKHWKRWNEAMKRAIAGSQHPRGSGARTGSWDPIGPWGSAGGRVYATACMVMCLEVYYRYDKVVGGR